VGVGIWVFRASTFVLGARVFGVLWHWSMAHSHFWALVCLGIGVFWFRCWCWALRQWCSASGRLSWHAWVGGCWCLCIAQGLHTFAGLWNGIIWGVGGGSPVWHSCSVLIMAAFLIHACEVHRAAELHRIAGGCYTVRKRGVGWSCR